MRTLKITDQAMTAIRSAAEFEFNQTGRRDADGGWLVPVADETAERIEKHRFPGETVSDAIVRIISLTRSSRN